MYTGSVFSTKYIHCVWPVPETASYIQPVNWMHAIVSHILNNDVQHISWTLGKCSWCSGIRQSNLNAKYQVSKGNQRLTSPQKTFSATMLSSLLAVAKIGFFWVWLVVCFFRKVFKEHCREVFAWKKQVSKYKLTASWTPMFYTLQNCCIIVPLPW